MQQWAALLVAFVALFVALSVTAYAQQQPTSPRVTQSATGGAAKQFPLHIVPMVPKGTAPAAAPLANLQYFGGPVVSNIQVVVVYWGNNVSSVVTTNIPAFYGAVTDSTYMDLLTEYNTTGVTPVGGTTPGNQVIGHGSVVGAFAITPSITATTVDDTQVQAEILAQITAGHLPAPTTDAGGNSNTEYMIYFPPGIDITQGGTTSCAGAGFCAYHGTAQRNSSFLYYGVFPDFGPTSGCSVGCGNGTELQNITSVSTHELAETITDAGVGLAATFAPPLAWYDQTNGEIGDICNAQQASIKINGTAFTVQTEWSNLQGACVSGPPTFATSLPAALTANVPVTATVTIKSSTGATLTNYRGTVTFTSTDSPATLPANYTFTATDAGTHTFTNGFTFVTSGAQTLTVTDTHSGGFVGTAKITVNADVATHFSVSAPASATSGTAFNLTVTALDASNNAVPGYTGTVHFTSTDAQAVLPANTTLTNGTGTFSATLKTAGSQTITATDTVTASITGTSNAIAISAPPPTATHFSVAAPASATAGIAFNYSVTALDANNAVVPNYTGTVHFTSTDLQAILPANTTLTNGIGTFSATLRTAGNQTITATDAANASITGISGNILVANAVVQHTTLTLSPVTGQYTDIVTLTATVAPAGVTGTVQFVVNGAAVSGSATYDSTTGIATQAYTIRLTPGTFKLVAHFTSSNPLFSNSSATLTAGLKVTKEETIVTPNANNPLAIPVTKSGGRAPKFTLRALIQQEPDGIVGNITKALPVSFKLSPVGLTWSTTCTTSRGAVNTVDGSMAVSCTFAAGLPANVYKVVISVGGHTFTGSAQSVLTVTDRSLGYVTGGGVVTNPNNGSLANFGIKFKNSAPHKGQLLYIEHQPGGDFVITSNFTTSVAISSNGAGFSQNQASTTGNAVVNGAGKYTFQNIAVDFGTVQTDQFGLQINAPGGAIVPDLTYSPVNLTGGNLVVTH